MLMSAVEILVILCLPAGILYLMRKVPALNTIGAIALCYACGFIFALLPIPYDKALSQTLASVLVAVAIPLILFGFDLRSVRQLAKPVLISYGLVAVSVIAVACAAAFIGIAADIPAAPQLSGMIVGLYTGGTPNLIAIGKALLSGDEATQVIAAANTSDFFVGGVYFLLSLTVIRPLYRRFLGDKRCDGLRAAADEGQLDAAQKEYDYRSIPRDRAHLLKLAGVAGLAVLALAVGAGLEILINGDLSGSLYIMVTVSVLGIALSFVRPVREVRGSYQLGQYLVLVFSLGLSMSIDLGVLVQALLPTLAFFACAQVATILLHLLLCKLFHIDGGTALITCTAGVYGPPFVAPVANAYGDRALIAPGVICGILGLMLGNLLGIGIGALLALLV